MLHLIPVALGAGVLVTALEIKKRHNPKCLSAKKFPVCKKKQSEKRGESVGRRILNRMIAVEETYQSFVQDHIDPLFGKAREMHLREFAPGGRNKLSQEERYANLRIGIGGFALQAALLGRFVYAPFMGVAILLGFSIISTFYYIAYLEWKRTRRLGSIHLTCIYDAFLWLGGYAAIGALGMFLIGIGLKIKVLTENRSHSRLEDIFQLQPSKVWIRMEDSEIEIPFEELVVGDILVLCG